MQEILRIAHENELFGAVGARLERIVGHYGADNHQGSQIGFA